MKITMYNNPVFKLFAIFVLIITVQTIFFGANLWRPTAIHNSGNGEQGSQKGRRASVPISFEGFNNETGSDEFLVPNIIHYVRFEKQSLSFVDYACMRSAYVNQKPDFIFIHSNVLPLQGYFWQKIQQESDFKKRVRLVHLPIPKSVFGQKFSDYWGLFHASDFARVNIMQKYGGIYLDNDMFVVQSLDHYRRFEMVVAWDQGQFLGNQIIICNANARFLPMWIDTYKVYDASKWYYNGGERPTVEVLYKRPDLVHRVGEKFGVHMLSHYLYEANWTEWRQQMTIHLLNSHRYYLDPEWNRTGEFNETNIEGHPATIKSILQDATLNSIPS